MKQYVTYAKMPKVEMLNIVRELNLEHGFVQDTIQLNFDINGKLLRYDNDFEDPYYRCVKKISKVKIKSEQILPIQSSNFELKSTKIDGPRDGLSQLQKVFLESKDNTIQKKMVLKTNEIVKHIQEIE